MIERLSLFAPELGTALGLAFFLYCCMRWGIPLIWPHQVREWEEDKKSLRLLPRNAVWMLIVAYLQMAGPFAPLWGEAVFRGPLLIIFSDLQQTGVWSAILISAVFFALLHWFYIPNLSTDTEILSGRTGIAIRVGMVVYSFGVGVLSGYLTVHYQSIWPAVAVHALLNISMIPLLLVIMSIFTAIVLGLRFMFDRGINFFLDKVFYRNF